jgi:ssDNA-binding Zn-finger/Zn-ribbon topoisomerase 1
MENKEIDKKCYDLHEQLREEKKNLILMIKKASKIRFLSRYKKIRKPTGILFFKKCPVCNHTLQKEKYVDPEFWNLVYIKYYYCPSCDYEYAK